MRLLYSVAGLCVVAVSLTGCSRESTTPAETMLTMPAHVHPSPEATGSPRGERNRPAGADQDGIRSTGDAEASGHCVLVAGGLSTATLAPLSLRAGADRQQLMELEQQLLELRDKLPADLHDDFTTLAHSAEAPPSGSGTFDEKAFREAMEPVEDWLEHHCTRH
ncbi:hypothetical protein E8P82_11205 [Arthrobacter echini]|uniref:Lipoprotein n=1 Tax=Arthrobacter echini TaxID=1529066 RepID=A0A4S5E351_9MICC|nr:hypothetical protein [Arthrobacter echini]THJ65844.1 hypothetical protein E8P82_11205 [Arthrobacter echini]